jgi:hypothetical protein
VSGIALQPAAGLVWLDNSLTAQVGSFNTSGRTFAMTSLSNCSAHPHDGLDLDAAGNVWFDEQFVNAIGELVAAAPGPSMPSVVTGSASAVGTNSATVAGSVNPNGQATVYHFEYGPSTTYGSRAPAPPDPSAGSGTTAQAVSANLTGLSPGTTYHYRLVASNASGTQFGSDQTFATSTTTAPGQGTVVAADSFNRSVAGGWGTADAGGPWTVLDTPASWSVAPGVGSVAVAGGGQARAVLGGVAVRDVDLLAKVGLPLCTGGGNCDSFLVGRSSAGGNPTYYRVGPVQGGGSTVALRAQRDDGSYLANDLNTGIPAAPGLVLWVRVQFQGVNPTAVRARIWRDGTTEPSTWLLNTTDSTAAEQAAGAVGIRARNEDFSTTRTFDLRSYQATTLP